MEEIFMVVFSYIMTGVAGLVVGILASLATNEIMKAAEKRREKKELKAKAEAAERQAIIELLKKNNE